MLLTDVTGLMGHAIAMVTLGVMLAPARLNSLHRTWLAVALLLVSLVPWNGLPLAGYTRGIVGDLSMSSLVLLAWTIIQRIHLPGALLTFSRELFAARSTFLALIALCACALYPLALGLSMFDPYRLGYASPLILGAFSLVAFAAWWRRQNLITLVLALSIVAWSIGWYESTNLWDYVLDPLVALYAMGALIRQSWKAWIQPVFSKTKASC